MLPLSGFRVVEASTFISGPFAAMLLADLGAEVIKVELPGDGDPFRSWGEARRERPQFAAYNRGKRSIALDLRDDDGQATWLDLCGAADAVIENFRPGTLDRQGIGESAIRERNPNVIYCSVTGFGTSGPYVQRPAYDAIAQAYSGLWSCFTPMDDPKALGPATSDQLAGMFAALGIASALAGVARGDDVERRVDVSMLASSLMFLTANFADYLMTGEVNEPQSRARRSQSYGFVAADGKPIAVHLSSPQKFWERLTDTLGIPEIRDDAAFASRGDRVKNYEELRARLQVEFAKRPRDEWLELLIAADVPVAPINQIDEAVHDPQVKNQGMLQPADTTYGEVVELVASPMVFPGTKRARPAVPGVGEHTEEILAELRNRA